MIGAGIYEARPVHYVFDQSTQGTDRVRVRFRVAATDEDIVWDGYLSPKAAERTLEALGYCGCDTLAAQPIADNEPLNMTGFGSRTVMIDVREEEFEGRTFARVRWVNAKTQYSAGSVAELRARLLPLVKRPKKSSIPSTDDDIPF